MWNSPSRSCGIWERFVSAVSGGQGGQDKAWDLVRRSGTVACVIFNTDTENFIMVQQFRPAVYVSEAAKVTGELTRKVAVSFIFKVLYTQVCSIRVTASTQTALPANWG